MFKLVDINKLFPNEWNSNEMNNFEREKLSNSLKKRGQLHPILVAKEKDKYKIIDGQHRWEELKKLGINEIKIEIKEINSKEELMLTSLDANLHGNNNEDKFVDIIEELQQTYDMDEILSTILYTENEINDLLNIEEDDLELNTVFNEFEDQEIDEIEEKVNIVKLKIELTQEEYELWLETLTKYEITNNKNINNKNILLELCKNYLDKNK